MQRSKWFVGKQKQEPYKNSWIVLSPWSKSVAVFRDFKEALNCARSLADRGLDFPKPKSGRFL